MPSTVTEAERIRMDQIVSGLSTISDKIRALDAAGFPRNKIASFLGKRYQHVRNVLVHETERKAKKKSNVMSGPSRPTEASTAMDALVSGLFTKADKIRALDRAGYSRSEIAKFLGIRYQHVRNVLVQGTEEPVPKQVSVSIDSAGRLVIPAPYRRALGLEDGDEVLLRLEGDELRLFSRATGIKRAQAIVAKYVPEGVSLVDELLAERRREAAAEEADG